MDNKEKIQQNYKVAVEGIDLAWLSNNNTKWYDYIVALPDPLLKSYLIVVFNNQVFNGGFDQYFVNGYGQFASETIEALREIGAMRKAELLEKAFNRINVSGDVNVVFRGRLLKNEIQSLFTDGQLSDFLEELDNRYYDDQEDLEKLLGNFLMFP